MYVDPDVRAVLDAADPDAPDFWELSPDAARDAMVAMVPAMLPIVDVDVSDFSVPSEAGEVAVRLYRAQTEIPGPLMVFFHGGGWEIGSIEVSDRPVRRLARDSGVNILSVEYRLTPEHPFPAGLDDCYAATRWAAANTELLGSDPGFLAVGGDSAGGNLAAAVAQVSRDRGEPRIDHQLLIYPVVTTDFDTDSYHRFGNGYFLTSATMQAFWKLYVGDGAAPAYADLYGAGSLAGLPETTIITCGLDPLADEGREYARRLGADGVAVTSIHVDGLIHGIWNMDMAGPRPARFGLDIAGALRRAALDPRVASLAATHGDNP